MKVNHSSILNLDNSIYRDVVDVLELYIKK